MSSDAQTGGPAQPPSGGGARKRRYKNFLLDPRFQLKYAVFISLTGGLIFGCMGWLFYTKVRENSQLAAIDELAATAPGLTPADSAGDDAFQQELVARLAEDDSSILWTLGGFWLVLIGALFLIGILATHRMVGPIYVVRLSMDRIMAGLPLTPRALRRGDEFQTLFMQVNRMAEVLREERVRDAEALRAAVEGVLARADTLGEAGEGASSLRAVLEEELAPARALLAEKQAYLDHPSGRPRTPG